MSQVHVRTLIILNRWPTTFILIHIPTLHIVNIATVETTFFNTLNIIFEKNILIKVIRVLPTNRFEDLTTFWWYLSVPVYESNGWFINLQAMCLYV